MEGYNENVLLKNCNLDSSGKAPQFADRKVRGKGNGFPFGIFLNAFVNLKRKTESFFFGLLISFPLLNAQLICAFQGNSMGLK